MTTPAIELLDLDRDVSVVNFHLDGTEGDSHQQQPSKPNQQQQSISDPELATIAIAKPSNGSLAHRQSSTAGGADELHPYLKFLTKLHSKWKDVPNVTVTYQHMSVTFDQPLRSMDGPTKEDPDTASLNLESVPNLWTTMKTFGSMPLNYFAVAAGLKEESKLFALDNASGVIHPGTMTLVLAAPGGGKSTLLKALSGRVPTSSLRGTLLYNGKSRDELLDSGVHVSRLSAYVGQTDVHFPTLTVGETIKFAADSSVPDPRLFGDDELVADEAERYKNLISLIGLSGCIDTIVGSDVLRGVSGGQRKRVTLGEMLVSNARLLCLDEVSTGLDAAVTTSIFTSIRAICGITGQAVVTTLLQPTTETYELFDQVILLHEGKVVYHGGRTDIKRWLWTECGLDIPVDVDEASFLCDFLNSPQLAYESAKIVAQSASFIESSRESRVAEHMADPMMGGVVTDAPTDPIVRNEMYNSYRQFSQQIEEEEKQQKQGVNPKSKDDGQGEPTQRLSSSTLAPLSPLNHGPHYVIASLTTSDTSSSHTHVGVLESSATSVAPTHPRREKGLVASARSRSSRRPGAPISDLNELILQAPNSFWFQAMKEELALHTHGDCKDQSLETNNWSPYTKSNFGYVYPHSYGRHVQLCFARQFKLFMRSMNVIIPRLIKALTIGCFYGLLFFQLPYDAVQSKMAICMYGAVYASMTNLSELPTASDSRTIISKHLDAGFYPPSPYTSAVSMMHIPLTVVESFCYGTLIYWIASMSDNVDRFFFYIFVCFIASNGMAAFYRALAYISPNPDVAKQLDVPCTVLFIVLNGFIISYYHIPPWIRYSIYWATPLHWGTNSLALNEFNDAKYDPPSIQQPDMRTGDYYINTWEMQSISIWKWWGVLYLACWYIFCTIICIIGLRRLSLVSPIGSIRTKYHRENKKTVAAVPIEDVKTLASTSSIREEQANDPTPDVKEIKIEMPHQTNTEITSLPFTPVTLGWSELNYSIPLSNGSDRRLLCEVNGFAKPNQMIALMGASGAGKTTLLDCLAGRKTTGKLTGNIFINGRPVDVHSAYFQQLCGYVEQNDLHMGTATVREALQFSARMRLPTTISQETQRDFVEEVMTLLGLKPFANSLVGDSAIPGLSPAQLKLLTIGVELVANPAVLFLDEPTSGLDSVNAWRVMSAIKRISLTGRTVICTIHQPSARLFFLFDALLLLQPGGRTIYAHTIGKRGETLISYFEAQTNFQQRLTKGTNPANWMLDVTVKPLKLKPSLGENFQVSDKNDDSMPVSIASKSSSATFDWADVWMKSGIHTELVAPEVSRQLNPNSFLNAPDKIDDSLYLQSWSRYVGVQQRLLVSYWRNGPMNITRALVNLMMGIFIGLIYYKIRPIDYSGVNSFMCGIYMSQGFGPSLSAVASLPTLFRQRAVYYRETTVRMYDYKIYLLSISLCELIAQFILQLIYIIPLYFLMDLESSGHAFWRYYLIIYLLSQIYVSLCQAYLAYLPNQVTASVIHAIIFSFFFVFGGLLVTAKQFPIGWKWFYYIIPTPKSFIALLLPLLECPNVPASMSTFADGIGCGHITLPDSSRPIQVYEYVSTQMENSSQSYGNQVGWLLLTIIVIRIFAIGGFKYVSHLKR